MIQIKSKKELEIIRKNARDLASIMDRLKKEVGPGVRGEELDELAHSLILDVGGKPSFKGYGGFPSSLCFSVNEEIVHGIPTGKILEEGDIVSLDLGLFRDGLHSDMAVTVPAGKISKEKRDLMESAEKALNVGIDAVGKRFGDISHSIQDYIEGKGYSVIRGLCGHGVGRELHEDPEIHNHGVPGEGERVKEGMVFCLEPMLSMGSERIKKGNDGFAYIPVDASLSAHYEHMIAVMSKGVEVLTR